MWTDQMSYFHRDGREATMEEIARSRHLTSSSIGYEKRKTCGRCGGAGGSEKWNHTGWTCYGCGGSGLGNGYHTVKLYTREKLDALNEAQAKRNVKRAAEYEAKRLEALREARKVRRLELPLVREFVTLAWPLRKRMNFINDMLRTVLKIGRVSEKQMEAVRKVIREDERKASSSWVGEVGERLVLTLTIKSSRIVSYRQSRYARSFDGFEPVVLTIFEDEAGNTFKTFNSVPMAFYTYDAENRENVLKIGEPVRVKATVKSHDEYKGEKSTMLQRISTKGA